MALDLAPYKIRVNTVSPLDLDARVEKAAGGDRAKWSRSGQVPHAAAVGNVEEVAAPVAFLLSDEASFITAAELLVDGGYHGLGSEGLGEASTFAGSSRSERGLRLIVLLGTAC